jgi:hypothetical protein
VDGSFFLFLMNFHFFLLFVFFSIHFRFQGDESYCRFKVVGNDGCFVKSQFGNEENEIENLEEEDDKA